LGTALIYPPATYAKTEKLIELCKVAGKISGKRISHMRIEANHLLEAFDELLRIAREADLPAEVYYIKPAGRAWCMGLSLLVYFTIVYLWLGDPLDY
jgi:N-acyl-D-amino-acid deacylase